MYGLPKGFDGSSFVGESLSSIMYTENNLSFAFGDDFTITSDTTIAVREQHDSEDEYLDYSSKSATILFLIGHKIVSINAESDGTLNLTFDDGKQLRFFDDLPQYESYHIRIKDNEIHV